jgi:hypothetical protein
LRIEVDAPAEGEDLKGTAAGTASKTKDTAYGNAEGASGKAKEGNQAQGPVLTAV